MKSSNDQKQALEMLHSGVNVFLTGDAGTGKSTIINEFCKQTTKQVMRCAPTAVAARLVNGATLHRTFGIPVKELFEITDYARKAKTYEKLEIVDVIIIDEISMVRSDVLQFVYNTLQKIEKKIQIVAVGDFGQLPPICKKNELSCLKQMDGWGKDFSPFCFTSKAWKAFDFKTICLHTVHRQQDDLDFQRNLQKIKMGDAKALKFFNEKGLKNKNDTFSIALTPTNDKADDINNSEISKIKGKEFAFNAIIEGTCSERPAPEKLKLKKGCRVVALQNKYIGDDVIEYINGDMGTVINVDNDSISVNWDSGKTSILEQAEWKDVEYVVDDGILMQREIGKFIQYPIRLAYAVTVHKSQGQTYENATIHSGMFENGQLYVALSRVRRLKGLKIEEELKPTDLKVSQKVIDFYVANGIIENSKKAEKSIEEPKEPLNFQKIKKGRGGKREGAPNEEIVRIPVPARLQNEVIAYVKSLF